MIVGNSFGSGHESSSSSDVVVVVISVVVEAQVGIEREKTKRTTKVTARRGERGHGGGREREAEA